MCNIDRAGKMPDASPAGRRGRIRSRFDVRRQFFLCCQLHANHWNSLLHCPHCWFWCTSRAHAAVPSARLLSGGEGGNGSTFDEGDGLTWLAVQGGQRGKAIQDDGRLVMSAAEFRKW
jgi:hypothetical protein